MVWIALIIGAACGVGQFFLLRRFLRPLSEGGVPSAVRMLSQLPIPIVLLLGCALLDVKLLPFAGGGFCAGLIASAAINLMHHKDKKD